MRQRRNGPGERELFKEALIYKTRLCNEFMRSGGRCPRGRGCSYAHGKGELRQLPGREEINEKIESVCLCNKPFSGCRFWPEASTGCHAVRPQQTLAAPVQEACPNIRAPVETRIFTM